MLGFRLVGWFFLVLLSSCATSGGKTQASPLFLGGAVMEFVCASFCCPEQWAAQGSATVKQIQEASLQDPPTLVRL